MFGTPSTTTGQYPVFVYGTLRHGQQNYELVRNRTVSELHAHTTTMQLYAVGAFPMIVPGNGIVHGDLLHLQPFMYNELLRTLDHHEGCRVEDDGFSVYQRKLVPVQINATQHQTLAWAYVGQPAYLDADCTHIKSGDWVQYRWKAIQKTRFGRYLYDTPTERTITECQSQS
jgi:gamma-glutamylcyclotransferase (GGCT)/AIG2-like uncharacterized protein YtfP